MAVFKLTRSLLILPRPQTGVLPFSSALRVPTVLEALSFYPAPFGYGCKAGF